VLVLSRQLSEKIILPSLGVTIQVVAVNGGNVRLGIDAPAEVKVAREERLAAPVETAPQQ
jgi:carbon storage regulator CsrA